MGRVLIVGIAVLSLSLAAPSDEPADSDQPVKPVVRSDKCLVYCLPGALVTSQSDPPRLGRWYARDRVRSCLRPGLTVVHVSLPGGRAKVLHTTGLTWSGGTINTRAQRRYVMYSEARCIGVMAVGDTLYVAIWRASSARGQPSALLKAGAPDASPTSVYSAYSITAYNLATGKRVGKADLGGLPLGGQRRKSPRANLPAAPPKEVAGGGVLSQEAGGVKLFGATFKVAEGKLQWSDAPASTQPATPKAGDPGK